MKYEVSAGGIIIKQIHDQWYTLVIKDRNKKWTFPKGKVEKNESLIEAAQREILEETGISDIEMLISLPEVSYIFQREESISKTVYYFLFQAKSEEIVTPQRDEGITDVQWIPFLESMDCIDYKETNVPLLSKAKEYIETHL